jgi:RNA polymerase sigma factor (sigma-70 family)
MAEHSTVAPVPLDVLFREGALGGLSDGQLLERFVGSGPAAGHAFDVLMARHGPMVLGVCRRILRDSHAADDSFQVTFLVLARRAAAIRQRDSLGPWLHGVARRVSLRARVAAVVRREREARAAIDPGAAEPGPSEHDIGPVLYAEIDRLPEKYRVPIIVCYLQGLTIDEAARQLGWPIGTVGGRLARARDRLRDRLIRRGLFAPAVLGGALARDPEFAPAVPQSLERATRDAMLQVAGNAGATTGISAVVVKLLEETMRSIALSRLMIGTGICGLVGALAIGVAAVCVTAGSVERLPSARREGQPKTATRADRAQVTPLVETLKQASQVADDLTDGQDKVNAHMALAWAQIRTGDLPGARGSLERAEKAAGELETAARCQARVRVAQALGECGGRLEGLALLAKTRVDAENLEKQGVWALKSIAVAQSQLGDRDAARDTIKALDLAILSPEERRNGIWKSTLSELAEAQLAVGDVDAAFRACIPGVPGEGVKGDLSQTRWEQGWMMAELAYFAADGNHQSRSGLDPPRPLTAVELATALGVVRRAVAAVEALPEPNQHRTLLATALGELGAYDEARQVARRVDQKKFQDPDQIDAIWAFWRISLSQAKAGKLDGARATLREAAQLETHPNADAQKVRARLAGGFVVASDFDEAIKIAETLDASSRAEILSKVARHKQRDGDRAGAEMLFHRALVDAGRFRHSPPALPDPERPGPPPVEGADALSKQGEADPNAQRESRFWSLLARIHARAGDWEAAGRALASISPENQLQRANAMQVARLRAGSGDVAGALKWARSLASSSLRAWALRGLAVGIFGDKSVD